MHQLTIQLSDDLFAALQQRAEASRVEMDVLLQRSLRAGLPPSLDKVPARFHHDLLALDQLDSNTLQRISQLDLSADTAVQYARLLEKQQAETLSAEEQSQLETWREEADVLMLRRAYAAALLKWREQAGI